MFNKKLRSKLEEQEIKVDHHKAVAEGLRSERKIHRSQITDLQDKNKKLTDQLSVYKNDENKYTNLAIRETKLEMREFELTETSEFLEKERATIAKRLEAAKKEAEKAIKEAEGAQTKRAEKQYENGYADGVADGLRKIHEITAEDRRMSMQIGALAAASHTPDAATAVAKTITDSFTKGLGSGKTKN